MSKSHLRFVTRPPAKWWSRGVIVSASTRALYDTILATEGNGKAVPVPWDPKPSGAGATPGRAYRNARTWFRRHHPDKRLRVQTTATGVVAWVEGLPHPEERDA